MRTWRRGRDLVRQQVNRDSLRIEHFVESVMVDPPLRVPGTAVFMTPSNDYLPPALLHNLKHNQVLHQRNVILTVETLAVPRAEATERVSYMDLGHGFSRLTLRFGYMEDPNVPKALKQLALARSAVRSDDDDLLRQPRGAERRRPTRAWRCGATSCSCSCRATLRRRRNSSAFPATGWWSWECMWRSEPGPMLAGGAVQARLRPAASPA